ncbi:MAG: hypothetical protein QXP03_06370 [Desulfurococcaceae archaeon]
MQKKHKKLTDFTRKTGYTTPGSKSEASEEVKGGRGEAEKAVDGEMVLKEVLEVLIQKQRNAQSREAVEEKRVEAPTKGDVKPEIEPVRDEKLAEIAQEAFGKEEITIIECNKQGLCVDGRKLSDVFEAKGLKWQRTFLNTTRLPIYLDFIAEEAEVKGRVGKAFIIVSARGAKAIVPDDFLCEALKRYGILIDTDKCSNYRPSPWVEKTRRRQR